MSVAIDFYWDVGSTNTYFALRLLTGVLARTGASVRYHPFNLGYVFRHYDYVLAEEPAEKLIYRKRDLMRWAEYLDLPFQMPEDFPIKTTKPLRGAIAARKLEIEEEYLDAIFTRYWEDGVSVEEYEVILPLVEKLGQDPVYFQQLAESDEVKAELIKSTTGGLERGVFGAPMFIVGEEAFWGKDRMDYLEREVQKQLDQRSQ